MNYLNNIAYNMELYLPQIQEVKRYNPKNGRFLKGHEPANKGKKVTPELYKKIEPFFFKKGVCYKPGNISKKTCKKVEMWKENKIVGVFYSITEASRKTGICRRSIGKVIAGERKTAGGFKWNYIS